MGFVPMDLCPANATIWKPNGRNPFPLSPPTGTVDLAKSLKLPNATPSGDCLRAGDASKNLNPQSVPLYLNRCLSDGITARRITHRAVSEANARSGACASYAAREQRGGTDDTCHSTLANDRRITTSWTGEPERSGSRRPVSTKPTHR